MGVCINCAQQQAMARSPYSTSGKNVKMITAKGNYRPGNNRLVGNKPSTGYKTWAQHRGKPVSKIQNPPEEIQEVPVETQEIPVETPQPSFFSQDVNTTINPLLDQYNNFSTDQERFNFLTQQGGSNGWKYAGQQLGLTPEQMAPMQAIANNSVGTKTFDYAANPQLANPITNSTTNYYDQNMQRIDKSAIPAGAQINQLPAINNTYNASQPLAYVQHKQGGIINYLSYFNY